MTETNQIAPSDKSNHGGSSLLWIVAAVLLVCIVAVYFIHDSQRHSMEDRLAGVIKANYDAQTNERTEALKKQEAMMRQEIAIVTEKNSKLEQTNKEMQVVVADVSKRFSAFMEKQYKDEKAKQDDAIAGVRSDLLTTNANLQKTENQVIYIQRNLKEIDEKLAGVNTSISGLTSLTGDLKKEYDSLRSDFTTVKNSSGDTSVAVQKLNDRTRLFELKVMAEKAKQAAVAAERGDYRSLFDQLNMKQ